MRVSCRIVAQTPQGQVPVAGLPDNVKVEWQLPRWLSGAEVTVIESKASADNLSYESVLRVAQGTTSQVRFAFIATNDSGVSDPREQVLTLPYSVETYGQLTTLENFFQSSSDLGKAGGFGLMTRDIFPLEMSLPLTARQTRPVCRMRDRLFVASSSGVYLRKDGVYRLFGGKPYGTESGPRIADARRRSLGYYPAIACYEGSRAADERLYVVGSPDRVHGLGAFWVSRLRPDRSGDFFVSPPNLKVRHINAVALDKEGLLYLFTADDDAPKIFTFDKAGKFALLATVQLPPGLTFAAPRPYTWEDNFPGSMTLAPNGNFWITLARANAVLEVERDGSSRLLASVSEFDTPLGITVHPSGDALVADHFHDRIARVRADRTVSTYIGGATPAPPIFGSVGPASSVAVPQPVGVLVKGRALYVTYEPAQEAYSGHLAQVEMDASGGALQWVTHLGGRLPLLPAGHLFKEAASTSRPDGRVPGGRFLGALGTAEHRADGRLCYLERIPSRLTCVVPDAKGDLRTQEVLGHPVDSNNPARVLTPVDSRAFGLSAIGSFTHKSGAFYVAQVNPPLIHKITWSSVLRRFERVTIAGSGRRGDTLSAADALTADLLRPWAIAAHADGTVYFSDALEEPSSNGTPADARIKRLVPEAGGKYRLETVAGNGVVGPIQHGADALSSPLSLPYDIKLNGAGELLVSQACAGTCGGLFRLTSAGQWERIAGGGPESVRVGEATQVALRARNFALGAGEDIYVMDGQTALRRLFRPSPGAPLRVETIADRETAAPACTGGAVSSSVSAEQIEATWRASLGSVCVGHVWGLAVRDRCASAGELELVLAENFADDAVQSLLVIAKRACR
jgi:hypothetical protein